MDPNLETDESPTTKSPTTRQGQGKTPPTLPTKQAKNRMLKSVMRTSPPQGTPGGPQVGNPYVNVTDHVQPLVRSPSHYGFQDHTHYSVTLGFMSSSLEIFSKVSTSTLNASKTVNRQDNPFEALKRLVNIQEGFLYLSPTW